MNFPNELKFQILKRLPFSKIKKFKDNYLFFLHNNHFQIKFQQRGLLTKTIAYLNHRRIISLKKVSKISGKQITLGIFHNIHYNIPLAATRKYASTQNFTIFEKTTESIEHGETIREFIILNTTIKKTNKLVKKNGKLARKKYAFYNISRKLIVKDNFNPRPIAICNNCKRLILNQLTPLDQSDTFHTYVTTDRAFIKKFSEIQVKRLKTMPGCSNKLLILNRERKAVFFPSTIVKTFDKAEFSIKLIS